MKKLLILLTAVILFAIPIVGSCQSDKEQRITLKAEFIELNSTSYIVTQKVVAKPSVITVNSQEAKIFMGDKVPIDVKNNKYKDTGLGISITPTLVGDNIALKVNWSSSWINSYSGATPLISEIVSKGELSCKVGETVILGKSIKETADGNYLMLVKITPTISEN